MRNPADFRMPTGQGFFAAADDTPLYCRWHTVSPSRARVVIVHGALDHSGRYENLIEFLNAQGYSAFAADLRGMGRSSGPIGDIERFDIYLDDLEHFIGGVEKMRGPAPTFLVGYSLGALIAARFTVRRTPSVNGLALMAMPLALTAPPNRWLLRIGRLLSGVLPRLPVPIGIDVAQLTSDTTIAGTIDDDPLCRHIATLRWATTVLSASGEMASLLRELALPVLALHGENDPISDSGAVRALSDNPDCSNIQIASFPGLRHALHCETAPGREAVFQILTDWLGTAEASAKGN